MRPQWFLSWYPASMYQKGLQSDRCRVADPKLSLSPLVFLSLLSPSNLAIEFAARLLGFVVMFIMVYDAIVSEHIPAFVMLLQTRRHRSRTAPEHYWDDFLEIWVLPSWTEAIFSLYFTTDDPNDGRENAKSILFLYSPILELQTMMSSGRAFRRH